MPKKIKDLVVREVSLCKEGMNPKAKIFLYKSKNDTIDNSFVNNEGLNMTPEDLAKKFEVLEKENAELKASIEKSKTELEKSQSDLEKAKADMKAATEKMTEEEKKKKMMDEMKKSLNEDVKKQFDAIEKEKNELAEKVAKMEAEQLNKAFEARVNSQYADLAGSVQTKVAVVKALDSIESEDVKKAAFELLKSANNAMKNLYKETGVAKSQDFADAETKLNSIAKSYRDADPTLSEAQAIDKAYVAHPELYEAMQ
ncbi:MAG: hypothetical protein ABFD50_07995 [Smithella sp.]